jgi:hypothetical protein
MNAPRKNRGRHAASALMLNRRLIRETNTEKILPGAFTGD